MTKIVDYKLPTAAKLKIDRLKQGDTLSLKEYVETLTRTITRLHKQSKKSGDDWGNKTALYYVWVRERCIMALEDYVIDYKQRG